MAAEWDNLIPDSRDMPSKNGSFHEDLEGIVRVIHKYNFTMF